MLEDPPSCSLDDSCCLLRGREDSRVGARREVRIYSIVRAYTTYLLTHCGLTRDLLGPRIELPWLPTPSVSSHHHIQFKACG